MNCLIQYKHHPMMDSKCRSGVEHHQLVSNTQSVYCVTSLMTIWVTSRVATRLLGHSRSDSAIPERSSCCGWAGGWARATHCAHSACCDTPIWPACCSQASYSANVQVYIYQHIAAAFEPLQQKCKRRFIKFSFSSQR